MWLLVLGVIGALIGYFTLVWLQVVFIVIVLAFLLKKPSGTVSDVIFLFYVAVIFVGMMFGNLVYFFPYPEVLSSTDLPDLKSWFIR